MHLKGLYLLTNMQLFQIFTLAKGWVEEVLLYVQQTLTLALIPSTLTKLTSPYKI